MNEQLITEGQSFYWILLSLSILSLLFVFFKYYLIPEWNAKKEKVEISEDALIKQFIERTRKIKNKILSCENQWQLDTLAYDISKFQREFTMTLDRVKVEQEVEQLIDAWYEKEAVLSASSPAIVT